MADRLAHKARNEHHRKKFGQHYLRSASAINGIVNAADLSAGDVLWEIGCGDGALTVPLLDRCARLGLDYKILERDNDIIDQGHASWPTVEFVSGDAVVTLREFSNSPTSIPPSVLVSNLPYSAGSAIFRQLFTPVFSETRMVLMFQKEVADRVRMVRIGDRGPMGVCANLLYDIRKIAHVPPGAFEPPPKVQSSVVLCTPKKDDQALWVRENIDEVWAFLIQAYCARRKILRNTLKPYFEERNAAVFTKRPEQLTLEEWVKLATEAIGGPL